MIYWHEIEYKTHIHIPLHKVAENNKKKFALRAGQCNHVFTSALNVVLSAWCLVIVEWHHSSADL